RNFFGEIVTVKVFEDNSLVRKMLEGEGGGTVLVIDGGGSERCALVGDQLAELAVQNRWNGIVVYGCVRDSAALANISIAIKALNTHPAKSIKRNEGQTQIKVNFGGVDFIPGNYIYGDEDGILVSPIRFFEL
ncbi:MAG: ribonuclease E activity regulator RraA, partial [Chitinophagales bacterium]|nr:ribonuclease E activity regulator RraA [Chitinophagales bacterium]